MVGLRRLPSNGFSTMNCRTRCLEEDRFGPQITEQCGFLAKQLSHSSSLTRNRETRSRRLRFGLENALPDQTKPMVAA